MNNTSYLSVPLETLLAPIDLTIVNKAMLTSERGSKLSPFEQVEVKELVLLAAETWLARDLQEFESVKVEQSYLDGKAFIDILAVPRGTLAPFNKYANGQVLIDWKTTNSPVDGEAFKNRVLLDYYWQWKLYSSLVENSTLFIYRGISRATENWRVKKGEGSPMIRTKEIILDVTGDQQTEVALQYGGVQEARNSLILKDLNVWPRSFGDKSCYAFGVECPFYASCTKNRMPLAVPPIPLTEPLSYSKMKLFSLCPERYRRTELSKFYTLEGNEGDEDSTSFGSVFHAGIANLYQQAFEKRNKL